MRSRTLSSDRTAFRKLFSRYSPLWVWYSVFLLLIYLLNLTTSQPLDFDDFYSNSTYSFALLNAGYGCISAMTLFGYLCDPRECNVVHSWPIQRESHFLGRCLAALICHAIPNTLFFLAGIPFTYTLSCAIRWLILMELQFVCFFGLAVLCMMLSGRKLAAQVLFLLINTLSLLVMWIISTLYQPRLYGVELNMELFVSLSPIARLFSVDLYDSTWPAGPMDPAILDHFLYAGVGIAAAVLAMILYRRRHLETAGDFIALSWLKPVFVLAMSISLGCLFTALIDLFVIEEGLITMILLALGLLTGYFSSMMLLQRNPRVFGLKSWLRCAAIVICVFLSLWITELDLLGYVEFVPAPDQVSSVGIRRYAYNNGYTTTDPEEIADITDLHQDILDLGIRSKQPAYNMPEDYDGSFDNLYLEYHLKNGRTVLRSYRIYLQEHQNRASYYHSQPEVIFPDIRDLDQLIESVSSIYTTWVGVPLLDVTDQESLLRAIWQDCEDGNMDFNTYYPSYEMVLYLPGRDISYSLFIPDTAVNTIQYIETNLLNEQIIEKISEEFDEYWKYDGEPTSMPTVVS